jgi:hypothetical protein
VTHLPLSLRGSESVFISFGGSAAADPFVEVSQSGRTLWPKQLDSASPVDPTDDSFTMAAWVRWIPTAIPLPIKKNGEWVYERSLDLPGPGVCTFSSPGQGRAGFAVGENGIVVFRYSSEGRVEPLLCYVARINGPSHVGVVYEKQTAQLFLNGKLVKTGKRAATPLYGVSGWEDRRHFAVELAALHQFDDMLVAAGMRAEPRLELELPAVDFFRGLAWASGRYRLKAATGPVREINVKLPPVTSIEGPWSVTFDRSRGGPGNVVFDRLDDWSKRAECGIRHYSGTACYRKRFLFEPALTPGMRVYLDLRRVADVAEIVLNGVNAGVLWCPPYRLDVTERLESDNDLEVRVTNRWVNRLIGDAQQHDDARFDSKGKIVAWPKWLAAGKPSPTGQYTFTSQKMWHSGSPLVTSGLLGPMRLLYARTLLKS